VVKSLLKNHANLNATDALGNTALRYAIANGNVELVKILCSTHSNLRLQDNEKPSLFHDLL
jgi:ankyrin repeat protein